MALLRVIAAPTIPLEVDDPPYLVDTQDKFAHMPRYVSHVRQKIRGLDLCGGALDSWVTSPFRVVTFFDYFLP